MGNPFRRKKDVDEDGAPKDAAPADAGDVKPEETPAPAEEEAAAAPEEEAAPEAPKGPSVTVVVKSGPHKGLSRTFSAKEHGKGFKDAAESFAKKFGGEFEK